MTRINADIDPATLHRRHLVAELREITMVPASLKRSLRTKTKEEVLKNIPDRYTLGKGHSELLRGKAEQLPSSQTTPRSVASNFTWCVSHTYQNPAISCLNWSL